MTYAEIKKLEKRQKGEDKKRKKVNANLAKKYKLHTFVKRQLGISRPKRRNPKLKRKR